MNLKELKYVLHGEDKLSPKLSQISGASDKAEKTLGNTQAKADQLTGSFRNAAHEIPGMGRALTFIMNPLTLATAGIATLTAGINKATKVAETFNYEFLDLQQLNLDKTDEQVQKLKQSVSGLSFTKAFDLEKTAKAFYDVQSITGKYGEEVENIVKKTGMFSKIFKADFTQTVSGAAQAMYIYGFNTSQVDDYLTSMYKTMKVGKTTLDELSQIQMEYAGSAAAAGQQFDSANKLFAVFSINAPSVRQAATETKMAFQDLGRKSTTAALEKIGITMTDIHGNLLPLEKIVTKMVPKFKEMSGTKFLALKEEIGGSLGLRALLDAVRTSGDTVLATFEQFDKTELGMNKAMRNAKEDLRIINEELKNKTKVLFQEIGQLFVPATKKLEQDLITIMDLAYERLRPSYSEILEQYPKGYAKDQMVITMKRYEDVISAAGGMSVEKYEETVASIQKKIEAAEKAKNKAILGVYKQLWKGEAAGLEEVLNLMFAERLYKGFEKAEKTLYGEETGNKVTGKETEESTTISKGLEDVFSGGGTIRNINVTVGKFTDEVNINSTTMEQGAEEAYSMLEEMFIRMIQGAEQAIS